MDVGVVEIGLASGVICDVLLLGFEVGGVSDAMLVIAGVPDATRCFVADCVGIAALYELHRCRG